MVLGVHERAGRRLSHVTPARVLVVDDDPDVRRTVVRLLEMDGYETAEADCRRQVERSIASGTVDLVLLDVVLGADDGFGILAQLRRSGDLPVILLTAKEAEADRVLGLRLGADDYVTKPFSGAELVARVATVLRRSARVQGAAQGAAQETVQETQSVLEYGELRIDTRSREVVVGERRVETTMKEFDLLAFLASAPRQVFTREQLLAHVWGSSSKWQDEGTVTEHVRRVRRKLDPAGRQDRWICTVRGVGYRFDP